MKQIHIPEDLAMQIGIVICGDLSLRGTLGFIDCLLDNGAIDAASRLAKVVLERLVEERHACTCAACVGLHSRIIAIAEKRKVGENN